MRRAILLLLLLAVPPTACSPLPKETNLPTDDLADLATLPAEYGKLASVTFAPQGNGATGWRELWFQNDATGTVTYVPVKLPDWKYYPKMVRTVVRPDWRPVAEVTP